MTKNKTMNRIELETAEEFGYTLTIEEIKKIQKEEIHNYIIKLLWAAAWVVMYLICNWLAFQFIADAIKENIIELKVLATAFNFMVQVGFYHAMNTTLKGGA